GGTAVVILAEDACWLRERVEADIRHRRISQFRQATPAEWWQRIVILSRRLERVAATLTGNTDQLIDILIIRLQLGVGEGPLDDGASLRQGRLAIFVDRRAANLEVIRTITPRLCRPMECAPNLVIHDNRRCGWRLHL